MNTQAILLALAIVAAIAATLFAWFVIDIGISTMARYREQFKERTRFQAREFFLFVDPGKIFAAHVALVVLGSLLTALFFRNLLLGLGTGAALGVLPRFVFAHMRQQRLRRFEEQLPDALTMLSGALRAGLSLRSAIGQLVIEAPAPLGQEFTLLLREQRLGATLEQSLNGLARRIPTPTTILTVSAMRIASETGGGLAEMLERTANTVRSTLQIEGKIGALTAQGKMQAWVVGLLPVGLMLVLNQMEPREMSVLWHSPMGWGALAVIGTLEALGIYVIRRIVAIDV
jgi:tight adherence protein B